MESLVTNLELIEQLARQRDNSNWRFRSYVKVQLDTSDSKLDSQVRETASRITSQIDCTTCANCCKTKQAVVDNEDIDRLAGRLGISASEFRSQFVSKDGPGQSCINRAPCPFLKDNLCSVYEDRPKACREFPYLEKPGFRRRMIGMVDNYSSCPIVFNTLEELKRSTGFLSRERRRRR